MYATTMYKFVRLKATHKISPLEELVVGRSTPSSFQRLTGMILGRKHIYLPHAQIAISDSKVKLFLKQGISHQLGRDAVVRFECENSAIDVVINFL